jgi:hypothetical protein
METMKSPGGFRFLATDGPFSAGVAADPGYQIVRARAPRYTPLTEGFRMVEKTLEAEGRPLAALCAMELRIPKPLNGQAFDEFNIGYVAQLRRWGLTVDGRQPAARTTKTLEERMSWLQSQTMWFVSAEAASSDRWATCLPVQTSMEMRSCSPTWISLMWRGGSTTSM